VITDTDMASEFLYLNQGRADGSSRAPRRFRPCWQARKARSARLAGPSPTSCSASVSARTTAKLRDAVFAALQKVFEKGVYAELIGKWGLEASALAAPTINQGEAP
jgi:polar amino acid transport system substrate-binding protein